MSKFQACLVAAMVASLSIVAWVYRYDVVPVARGGEGTVIAGYRLDRWTGQVTLLIGARHTPVIEKEPER